MRVPRRDRTSNSLESRTIYHNPTLVPDDRRRDVVWFRNVLESLALLWDTLFVPGCLSETSRGMVMTLSVSLSASGEEFAASRSWMQGRVKLREILPEL